MFIINDSPGEINYTIAGMTIPGVGPGKPISGTLQLSDTSMLPVDSGSGTMIVTGASSASGAVTDSGSYSVTPSALVSGSNDPDGCCKYTWNGSAWIETQDNCDVGRCLSADEMSQRYPSGHLNESIWVGCV